VIVTFREGLMAGERFYYDLATLPRQISASALPRIRPFLDGSAKPTFTTGKRTVCAA